MKFLLVFLYLFVHALAVHDSLNFLLQPLERQCFFEDFDSNTPVRTVEAFVLSGGNVDVLLTIHGPLDLESIRKVSQIAIAFLYY